MEAEADLAAIGRLIGDPNRAHMLNVLLGGTPQSGSALAAAAGISRSLASAHLKKLTAGGLVRAERRGRQQLYSIAAQPVADALEILQLLAPATAVRSLRGSAQRRNLRWARMCYDHLAGVAGVAVTEALAAQDAIAERDGAWVLGARGARVFAGVGIDVGRRAAPHPAAAAPLHGLDRTPPPPRRCPRRRADRRAHAARLAPPPRGQPDRHGDPGRLLRA